MLVARVQMVLFIMVTGSLIHVKTVNKYRTENMISYEPMVDKYRTENMISHEGWTNYEMDM